MNPVEIEAGADYRAWLANQEPPSHADVCDDDQGLDIAEWLAEFEAAVDELADHFEGLAP